MKIGIDVHGTIDWDPEFWRKTIKLFLALGYQVHIISGPEEDRIKKRLEELGIECNDLYIESVADYIKEKMIAKNMANFWYDKNGDFWTTDEVWWKSKAEICNELEIDVIIDDRHEYFHHELMHDTRFILYQKGRFVYHG